MKPTMQLIELQTYLISKGKTMIDETGYKKTPVVMNIIAQLWNEADEKGRGYIEKLVAGTEYSVVKDD